MSLRYVRPASQIRPSQAHEAVAIGRVANAGADLTAPEFVAASNLRAGSRKLARRGVSRQALAVITGRTAQASRG